MLYANTPDGNKIPAEPRAQGACPDCGGEVIAKCGEHVCWHWAHRPESPDSSCPNRPGETPWHLAWKRAVRPESCEVRIGPHRADIVRANGSVLELQHSAPCDAEVRRREAHYGRMHWLYDARDRGLRFRPHATRVARMSQSGGRSDDNLWRAPWPGRFPVFLQVATKPLVLDTGGRYAYLLVGVEGLPYRYEPSEGRSFEASLRFIVCKRMAWEMFVALALKGVVHPDLARHTPMELWRQIRIWQEKPWATVRRPLADRVRGRALPPLPRFDLLAELDR